MKKIITIAGSNSSDSINKQLIQYLTSQIEGAEYIDLLDFEPPIYSSDLEKEYGTHDKIKNLVSTFQSADAVVISTPEHNSMPPAFFKNILDWLSRTPATYMDGEKYLQDKPVLLMSVSPGKGAAASAQNLVAKMIGYGGANIVSTLGVGSFYDRFKEGRIVDEALQSEVDKAIEDLVSAIK
jgi:chromate reductase